ncbi:MAG: hypothetical protein ACFB0G_08960 [Leptolyngbyaceae cyanobacterium]
MEKIKGQASRVSELVFAADTATTYQKAIVLTLKILRETAVLLWLAVCLVFVGGEWFWKNSISLGRKGRDWYNDLQAPSADEEPKSATAIGQSALTALGTSTETLLYKAKQQLGIDAQPPAPKPVAPTTSAPKPATPAPPPAPQATAAPPTTEALPTDSDSLEDDDSEL